MRFEDPFDQEAAFKRFLPVNIVRTTLREGLSSDNPDAEMYEELVAEHTKDDGSWKALRYQQLEERGVITRVSGVEELVNAASKLPRWKVMVIDGFATEPKNGELKPGNKLWLDSEETVSRSMYLPERCFEDGYVNEAGIHELRRAGGYRLREAIVSALEIADERQNNDAVAFVFKNRLTGEESRIFPLSLVKGLESICYSSEYGGEKAEFSVGNRSFIVPKRHPNENVRLDEGTQIYLANFSPIDIMWWFGAKMGCRCRYARERSEFDNDVAFEHTKRLAHILEDHDWSALMEKFRQAGEEQTVNTAAYIPIPTNVLVGLADVLRYSTFKEEIVEGKTRRKPLSDYEINLALMEKIMRNPGGAFLVSGNPWELSYVMNPLHRT